MEQKICVINCWYGEYPWYLPYFIHSCSFNASIEFIIITDNVTSIPYKPANVKIIHKTLEEIKASARQKFGFAVNIDYPYKLCDLKPSYGLLFSDLIIGYDFWGQCDLDIIWGNIRGFITNEMLNTYDFISLRHDYTTGCFALYRNNKKMNTFFMRSKDYKLVFSSSQFYSFCECNFEWDELAAGKSILVLETKIDSFTYLIKSAEIKKEINAHFDFILIEGKTGRIMFDNGKIIYKNKFEAVLYHLFWLKRIRPLYQPQKIPGKYYISPTRIYHNRKPNIDKRSGKTVINH